MFGFFVLQIYNLLHNLQAPTMSTKLQIGLLCAICMIVAIVAAGILYKYYKAVPYLKRNLLTRLDELYVFNYAFFVCLQCLICLISLSTEARNDYAYLVLFVILYTSLNIGFAVATALSFCRVFIIKKVGPTI